MLGTHSLDEIHNNKGIAYAQSFYGSLLLLRQKKNVVISVFIKLKLEKKTENVGLKVQHCCMKTLE